MPLKEEYDGDVFKVPGDTTVAAVLDWDSGKFIGLYALTQEGTYLRGNSSWITATQAALHRINGAHLVPVKKSFIKTFDKLDSSGKTPTASEIKSGSVNGKLTT